MKREDIGFRELLERVLPLQELPPAERLQVQRALNSGIESELERAAYLTIETLEGSGALLPNKETNYGPTFGFGARYHMTSWLAGNAIVICLSAVPLRVSVERVRPIPKM